MKMCRKCYEGQKKQGGYLRDEEIVKPAECSIHPRMDNWRVARTLKTLIHYGIEGEGTMAVVGAPDVPSCRVKMTLEDGWIHLRNLKLLLFDYEVPFFELLEREGMIEGRECRRGMLDVTPAAVRPTTKGHVWIRELQLKREAQKEVEDRIEHEKILAGL